MNKLISVTLLLAGTALAQPQPKLPDNPVLRYLVKPPPHVEIEAHYLRWDGRTLNVFWLQHGNDFAGGQTDDLGRRIGNSFSDGQRWKWTRAGGQELVRMHEPGVPNHSGQSDLTDARTACREVASFGLPLHAENAKWSNGTLQYGDLPDKKLANLVVTPELDTNNVLLALHFECQSLRQVAPAKDLKQAAEIRFRYDAKADVPPGFPSGWDLIGLAQSGPNQTQNWQVVSWRFTGDARKAKPDAWMDPASPRMQMLLLKQDGSVVNDPPLNP